MGGMTLLLLLLWGGVTASTAVVLQKRIYGGKTCGPGERQYHVKLTDSDDDLVCGGSLISDRWILTAAHCWEIDMKAFLGLHAGKKETMQITAPPVMFGDNTNKLHDIMLLQLPNPSRNPPVKLPECKTPHKPNAGDKVQIAGYAATNVDPITMEETGPDSSTLQCADIKVCVSNLKTHEHVFCGDKVSGVDICSGDSGGGVEYKKMIYGVNVASGKSVCAINPIFMDVCAYMDWIKKTIS